MSLATVLGYSGIALIATFVVYGYCEAEPDITGSAAVGLALLGGLLWPFFICTVVADTCIALGHLYFKVIQWCRR